MRLTIASAMLAGAAAASACANGANPWLSEGPSNGPPTLLRASIDDEITRHSRVHVRPEGWNDPDGDAPRYRYRWLVNGKVAAAEGDTFGAAGLSKGDELQCEVTPYDGHLAGPPVLSNTVVVGDTPANVLTAVINGGPFYSSSTITVEAFGQDPDGEPIAYTYRWYVNDALKYEGDKPSFSGAFVRGNRVYAEVAAKKSAVALKTNVVVIDNTPPSTPGVALYPTVVTSGVPVWAFVVTAATDADGDSVHYAYTWYKDGEPQSYPANATAVPAADVHGGENWAVAVEPNDGFDYGFAAAAYGPAVMFAAGEKMSGAFHTCARTVGGQILCWGLNDHGQLGDGTLINRSKATTVSGLLGGFQQVAVGNYHSCALNWNSDIFCWGRNDQGQLGDNTLTSRSTPIVVVRGTANGIPATLNAVGSGSYNYIAAVAAGGQHTCALHRVTATAYKVYCWGANDAGQLAKPLSLAYSAAPRAINDAAVDGGSPPATFDSIYSLALGESHSCMRIHQVSPSTDVARCWGGNLANQLANANAAGVVPAKVKACASYTCTSTETTDLTGVAELSVGGNSGCARLTTGKVRCWGGGRGASSKDVVGITAATAVSTGMSHSCVIEGGGAKCWGNNFYGQIGNGEASGSVLVPTPVASMAGGVLAISAGVQHTCAYGSARNVQCWGDNSYGQLGIGEMGNSRTPAALGGWVVQVAGGDRNMCALVKTGDVYCWGRGDVGTNGNATWSDTASPVKVQGLPGAATQIAVGYYHACALMANTTLYCWGYNDLGQLGDGTQSWRNTAVKVAGALAGGGVSYVSAGAYHTCALANGLAYCWGYNVWGQLGFAHISAYTYTSSTGVISGLTFRSPAGIGFLKAGDRVIDASSGKIVVISSAAASTFNVPTGQTGLDGGDMYIVNASDEWEVVPTPVVVTELGGGFVEIQAGEQFSCAIRWDSAMFCWGGNWVGQLGRTNPAGYVCASWSGGCNPRPGVVSAPLNGSVRVARIAMGGHHNCAVTTAGLVYCFGWGYYGQLGDNGGTDRWAPVQVSGLDNVSAVDVGVYHTCAVKNDGSTWCWGNNSASDWHGGAARNSKVRPDWEGGNQYNTPVQVWTLEYGGAIGVAVGNENSCAILNGGNLECWGGNDRGQLGYGDAGQSQAQYPWPVNFYDPGTKLYKNNPQSLSVGGTHACAIGADASVDCWGLNNTGQIGNGAVNTIVYGTPTPVVGLGAGSALQVVTGYQHSCALTSSGGVLCWGDGEYGQIGMGGRNGIPTGIEGLSSGVSQIAAGFAHTCALLTSGQVKCWGNNDSGQLGGVANGTSEVPVTVVLDDGITPLGGITKLSAGALHTCGINGAGDAYCWGNNAFGQVGIGRTGAAYTYTPATGTISAMTLETAWSSQFANWVKPGDIFVDRSTFQEATIESVTASQIVLPSGLSAAGFDGGPFFIRTRIPRPQKVATLPAGSVVTIAGGERHACAIILDSGLKKVYCWGNNAFGQVGTNPASTTPEFVNPNRILYWYPEDYATYGMGQRVDAEQISLGANHTCVTNNWTIRCWGQNTEGQIGRGLTSQAQATQIEVTGSLAFTPIVAAGLRNTCAVQTVYSAGSAGKLICWGDPTLSLYGALSPRPVVGF